MKLETFFEKFGQLADAPNAVAKMRQLVLQLAIQGKLVEQEPKETSAKECVRRANKPLLDVTPDETIETPVGWLALPLGCLIASNTGGGTPSKQNPDYWNGPIPWASVKDVQADKYLVSTIDSITEDGLENSSSNLIPPNRLIVVTRMGLGKLAINTIPIAINQDLRAIEPTSALDLDFAYLLFGSLKLVGTGVTVKGITVDKLHAMMVSIPPLAEQKRIVAKVDELMALCDQLEEQQRKRETQHVALAHASLTRFSEAPIPASLDHLFHPSYTIPPANLRKSILLLGFEGKLVPQADDEGTGAELLLQIGQSHPDGRSFGNRRKGQQALDPFSCSGVFTVPSSWSWTYLDFLCETIADVDHNMPKAVAHGVPFISAKDLKDDGTIDFSAPKMISEEDFRRLSRKVDIRRDDIVYSRIGARLGKARLVSVGTRFLISYSCCLIRPMHGFVDKRYLQLFLDSTLALSQAHKGAQSIGVPDLGLGEIKAFQVPLPPLAEQRRIVAKVDQLMALVDQLEIQLTDSRATAGKLMEAVVRELVAEA